MRSWKGNQLALLVFGGGGWAATANLASAVVGAGTVVVERNVKKVQHPKGGIVGAPTTFPMRGGMGLMGEAGPEAIMPLARGPDGRLGVQAGGGRGVNVVMNITTPDVQGFQRSQSQVAAQVSRALSRGQRNR